MKTIFYTLILIGTFIYPTISRAQKMGSPQVNNAEIKDRISKYYKFQDAYLLTLTEEQRKELFYHRRKGEKVTDKMRETDVKYDEERFQRAKEKYDKMTDVQRDSILTVYKEDARKKGKIEVEVEKVIVDESIFEKVSVSKDSREEILDIFTGHPAYIITTKRKLSTGEVVVDGKNVLYYKSMYPIFGIMSLHGS